MAARQHDDFVVKPVPLELFHRLARKFRKKSQIVFRVNNERLLSASGRIADSMT